jgi:hypothetical protein
MSILTHNYRIWEDRGEVFDENDSSFVVRGTSAQQVAEMAHVDRFNFKRSKDWIVLDESNGEYRQISTEWGPIQVTSDKMTTLKMLKDE